MLIISRRPGERIVVGDNVRVEVIEVTGQNVRIGIDAPRAIPVYREELWEAVRQANREAARDSPAKFPKVAPRVPRPPRPGS